MNFFKEYKSLVKDWLGLVKKDMDEIMSLKRTWTFPSDEEPDIYKNWVMNTQGFRSDEFEGDGIIFLGCSFTEGYGLETHETWPWIVGDYFNLKVWNLAQTGEGDDVAFLNLTKWIHLKPKAVCFLMTPPARWFWFDRPNDEDFYLWKMNIDNDSFLRGLFKNRPKYDWLFNTKNIYVNCLKNILAMKSICDLHNIPFITQRPGMFHSDGWLDVSKNGHPGRKTQKIFSKYYIEELKKCI